MIVFIDVKNRCLIAKLQGSEIELPPIDSKSLKDELSNLSKVFSQGGSVDCGVGNNLVKGVVKSKGNEYPSFFIDAGFLTEEVIKFVETCEISNVYAVKLMPEDLKILATSGKQQRSPGKVTDSNTLTMRLIQHSITAPEQKKSIDRQPSQLTHQETTDRINALATALDSLGNYRSIASTAKESPVNKAIDDIATELSKLTSQD
ncbi:hypothetical protein NVP1181O_22 [Vibrio phage 1.181.O._10N.286.46.C9]|nr:hypothetical protein NVP1181O_22 [Vibrio phage 1.181.O._10N.286.46.C9]